MSREKNLVKNTFVLSIGKILPRLTTFITLPILTAYLTKTEYGTYDLIDTLVALVLPVATLQIQSAAFRFLIDCRGDKDQTSEIISNILIVTIPISIIAGLIMPLFFPDFTPLMKVLLCAHFIFDTLHVTLGQIVRGLGYNRYYSTSAIMLSVTRMLGVIVCVYLGKQGLLGVLIALVASHLAAIAINIRHAHLLQYIHPGMISFQKIKQLIGYSWGLIPNNLSNWILRLSDRMVITAVLGIEANAVYSVANKIPNLLTLAQQVLTMAWQENASIAVNDEDASEYYTKMLDRIFTLMFGCTALLIAACPLMFVIFIRGDYDQAYVHIPILVLAMFFSTISAYFGGIYIAHKRTASIGVTTLAAAILNLAIDLGTVRVIGIWAGSLSTLAAYFMLYIYRAINIRKFQKMHMYIRRQASMIIIMAVMAALCISRIPICLAVNWVLGIGFFTWFNRELLTSLAGQLKSKLKK